MEPAEIHLTPVYPGNSLLPTKRLKYVTMGVQQRTTRQANWPKVVSESVKETTERKDVKSMKSTSSS